MSTISGDSVIDKLCQQAEYLEISGDNPNYVEIEDYEKERHWSKMNLACEVISKECTKMAVAFSKEPLPNASDTKLLIKDIAEAVDILLAWYNTFPIKEGKILYRILSECVQSILHSVAEFISPHQEKQDNKSTKLNLVSTGNVWECCKKFKSLPRDNISAVINVIESDCALLSDAINEINTSLKEQKEDDEIIEKNEKSNDMDLDLVQDDKWSEDECKLVKPCLCLFMAARGLLKKTKTMLHSLPLDQKMIELTDQSIELYKDISSSIDDVVMCLYPPIDRTNLTNSVQNLNNILEDILLFLKSAPVLATEENKTWIVFLGKAVNHNLEKFKLLINIPTTN